MFKLEVINDEYTVKNENDLTILTLENEIAGRLVVSALNIRERTLTRLAHDFVNQANNGDSDLKLGDLWRGMVLSNGLTLDDSDELWDLIRKVLNGTIK